MKGDVVLMKKIILMIILALSVVGCELLSPNYWNDVNRENAEKGIRCYRRNDGYFYCKDKYGNRAD